MRLAVDVAREVLGRPADLEQRLLEPAAFARVHRDRVGVDAGAEHRDDALGADDLFEHRPVEGLQHEAVRGVVGQAQPPVPVHGVGDVDEQRMRHRELAVPDQRVDDLLGVMAGRARVPQRERA